MALDAPEGKSGNRGCFSGKFVMLILGVLLALLIGGCILGGFGFWGFFQRAGEVMEVQP